MMSLQFVVPTYTHVLACLPISLREAIRRLDFCVWNDSHMLWYGTGMCDRVQ